MSHRWRGCLGSWLKLVARVVATSAGLAAAVAAIGWLVGWRAATQYVNALTLAGMACLVLAFLTVGGHWTITRSPNYVLSESVSAARGPERARRRAEDLNRTYGGSLWAGLVGAALIALGLLMNAIAR